MATQTTRLGGGGCRARHVGDGVGVAAEDARRRTWDDNHERLYEAALREIQKSGFNEMRIDRVCKEVNLSRPTFYAHFSNKDAVVSELLGRYSAEIAGGLKERTKGLSDFERVLDELVTLYHFAHTTVSEPLQRELAAYIPRYQDVDRVVSTSPVFIILIRAITQAARYGRIRAVPDARALARRIAVVISGFFLLAHPNEPERAAQESREMLKLILEGLRRE